MLFRGRLERVIAPATVSEKAVSSVSVASILVSGMGVDLEE